MMKQKTFSVYTLAINPDERIIRLVKTLKRRLKTHLGRSYGSVNSLAHITLIVFVASEDDYQMILAEFKRVLAGLAPLEIELSGFGDFSEQPECTFYIKPGDESVQQIARYCKSMGANFNKLLRQRCTDRWDTIGRKKPHMTIACELTLGEIKASYEFFSGTFTEQFTCNSFVMRKYNEEKRQYEFMDTIPLLGHEYMVGQQMRLF
ncbi:2'-5' RNA ligase family protein [Dyadobacter sp. CY351]|uniref:2'-5' RNA ligase family protein n=1 Tax=Dyadobacter sp. CY351 TaxID=2909337 RepID=UPI001F2FD2C2|nr:2'-5' RNA ligase family protein [Dyadobacter sp. CY351]MCF2518680.1 2'-5' RNA ligase family protein [Dyadobacter sp. CY351]